MLTYRGKGYQKSIDLILKIYLKSIEPVLKNYAKSRDFAHLTNSYPQLYTGKYDRCVKEFQVLSSLERVNFPAPKICHYELDSSLFGSPFLIMKKEKLDRISTNYLDTASKNLVRLHNLDLNALGIKCLKTQKTLFFSHEDVFYISNF